MRPPKDLKEQLDLNSLTDPITQAKWTYSNVKYSDGLREYLTINGFTTEDLNQTNKEGWTPLTLAILRGEQFAAHELVRNLVNVNKRNINGDTPLELILNQLEKNKNFSGLYHLLVDSGAKNNQGSIVKEGDIWRQVERYFQSETGTTKVLTTPWSTQKDTDPLEVFIPGYLKTVSADQDVKNAKDTENEHAAGLSEISEQHKKEPYYFLTLTDREQQKEFVLNSKDEKDTIEAGNQEQMLRLPLLIRYLVKKNDQTQLDALLANIISNKTNNADADTNKKKNLFLCLSQLVNIKEDTKKQAFINQIFQAIDVPLRSESPDREIDVLLYGISIGDFDTLSKLLPDEKFALAFLSLNFSAYRNTSPTIQYNLIALLIQNHQVLLPAWASTRFKNILIAIGILPKSKVVNQSAELTISPLAVPALIEHFIRPEYFDLETLRYLITEQKVTLSLDLPDFQAGIDKLLANYKTKEPRALLLCLTEWKTTNKIALAHKSKQIILFELYPYLKAHEKYKFLAKDFLNLMIEDFSVENTQKQPFIEFAIQQKDPLIFSALKKYNGAKATDYLFNAFCILSQLDDNSDQELNEIYNYLIKQDPQYFSKVLKEKSKQHKLFTETLVNAIKHNKIRFIHACLDKIFTKNIGQDIIFGLIDVAKYYKNQTISQLLNDHFGKSKVLADLPSEPLIIIKPAKADKKLTVDLKASDEKTIVDEKIALDIKKSAELSEFTFDIDLEIFSQEQNDYQLSGSELQGNALITTARYRKNMVLYMLKNKTHEELLLLDKAMSDLEKIVTHFDSFEEANRLIGECITKANQNAREKCQDLENRTPKPYRYDPDFNDRLNDALNKLDYDTKLETRYEYANKIAKLLETQNSILLPAGWLSPKKGFGHAMLVKIEKMDKASEFRITVYNTGSGLEYHKKILVKTKIKCCSARVFEQISKQQVIEFIENIILKPAVNPFLWNGKTKYSDPDLFGVKDVYKAIDEFKLFEADPLKFSPSYITPQRAGTCASKVFSPFFKNILNKNAQIFKYKLKELINVHLITQLKKNKNMDNVSAQQLEHSLHNFSRMLKKLESRKVPILSLLLSYQRVQEYERLIHDFRILQQTEEENRQKRLLVSTLTPSPAGAKILIETGIAVPKKLTSDEQEKSKQDRLPYETANLKSFDEIEMISFIDNIAKYYKNGQFQAVKDLTNHFMMQWLPLPNFKKIGMDKSKKLIDHINYLLTIYNESCLQNQAESTSEGIIINITLLLLSAKIVTIENGELINAFDLTNHITEQVDKYQNTILTCPFFNIIDLEWLKTLQCLNQEIVHLKKIETSRATYDQYSNDKRYNYALLKYPDLIHAIDIHMRNQYNQRLENLFKNNRDTRWERPPSTRDKIETLLTFSIDIAVFAKDVLGVVVSLDKADDNVKKIIEQFRCFIQDVNLSESLRKTSDNLSQLKDERLTKTSESNKTITAKLPLSRRYPSCDSPIVQFILTQKRFENPNEIQNITFLFALSALLSADLARKLLHIRVDKRNQVFSTIDFFMRNQQLFCEKGPQGEDYGKDYQLLFHCYLFEPGILQAELAFNKNLANHIISFCEMGIKLYRQQPSLLPAGAFLYEQAALLLPFLPIATTILDLIDQEIQIFRDLESKFKLTHENRLAFGRLCKVKAFLLLSTLSKDPTSLNKKDLIDFFRLYTKSKQLSLQSPMIDESSKIIDAKIKTVLTKLYTPISQILSEADVNIDLMTILLKENFPEQIKNIKFPLTLIGKYPLCKIPFISTNENLQLDLELGQVYLKGNMKPGFLPRWLREEEDFKAKFGNINPKAIVSSNQDVFEFEHQGFTYRIICSTKGYLVKILVKMLVNNTEFWCEQQPGYHNLYYFKNTSIPKTIIEDYTIYRDTSGQEFLSLKTKEAIPTLKINPVFNSEERRLVGNLFLLEDGKQTYFRLRELGRLYTPGLYKALPEEIVNLEQALQLIENKDFIEVYDNIALELEEDKKKHVLLAKEAATAIQGYQKDIEKREKLIAAIQTTIKEWSSESTLTLDDQTIIAQQTRKIEVLSEGFQGFKDGLKASTAEFKKQTKLDLAYKTEQEEEQRYLLKLQTELKDLQEKLTKSEIRREALHKGSQDSNFDLKILNVSQEGLKKDIADHQNKIRTLHEKITYGHPPVQIKLPRYNLHFISKIYNNKWQLFLKDMPSLRLVLDEPILIFIKSFRHCLYLEDIETQSRKRFALIPMHFFNGNSTNTGKDKLPNFNLNDVLDSEKILHNSKRVLKISIENNKLVPDRGEDLVYLAYVNLYQMNPKESYRLLTEGRKSAALLGTAEEENWLLQIVQHHHNKHTTLVFNRSGFLSVQLQAVYLLIRNTMEINPRALHNFYQDKDLSEHLTQLLVNYLNTLGNTPIDMQLTPEVELAILRFVKNHPTLNFSKLPKTVIARHKNLLGWEQLKERQILLSRSHITQKGNSKNEERLEEINQQLLQGAIKIPYSFEFEKIDPRKIKELHEIEKYQTADFDKMLTNKKAFVANFQFLATIMLIKEPIERYYAKELVPTLIHKKQKLTKSLTDILDNLNFRNFNARKRFKLELSEWDKLIIELSKTLLFASQNPDAYTVFVTQLQDQTIENVILIMNAQNGLFNNELLTLDLPVNAKLIDEQWSVKNIIPLPLIKPLDNKQAMDTTLQTLYNLPKFASALSEYDKKAADESGFAKTLPQDMQADYLKGKAKNESERHFEKFCLETVKPHIQKIQKEFSEKIQKDITKQQSELDTHAQNMVAVSNKQFEALSKKMALSGQAAKLLTMTDLITLFLNNDQNKYSDSTGLQAKEIEELHNNIHQWLLKTTKIQQLKRAATSLSHLNQNNLSNPESSQIWLNIGKTLYTERAFDPYRHPILLVFEHFEELLLRPEQISMLADLLENIPGVQKDKILQLIMGGGKSKVLMPLAAKLNATGDRLYFVEVPEALFEPNLSDLQSVSRKIFNQETIPFKFFRDEPYDAKYLESIFYRFYTCMLQKNYIVTTGNSMRSLALKRYDLLEALCKDPTNDELWAQLKWVEKILDLIKTRSGCFMDEVDLGLNIQQDLNYPLGQEQGLDLITLQAIQELYWSLTQLEETESVQDLLKLYSEKSKEYVQKKLDQLPVLLVKQKNTQFAKILEPLNDDEVNNVIDYLKNRMNTNVSFMAKLSKTNKDILSLYRHQINNLLASTLPKKLNEHYGLSQLPPKASEDLDIRENPIPYFMSKPKEGSQFANIYTAINYAIQNQYLTGIKLHSLKRMVTYFSEKALLEFKTNRTPNMITLSHTKAAKEFHEITGIKLPLDEIDVFDNQQMNILLELTKRNPRTISYVLNHYILPKIKTHSETLNMNAVQHASLYKNIQAVSGTTANWRTFHQRFQFDEAHNLGTDGQTIDRILTKKAAVNVAEGQSADEILSGYFSKSEEPDKVHALIDIGALFTDYTNEQVVNAIEKNIRKYQTKCCDYILYFNSANILCAKSLSNTELPPIEIRTTEINIIKKILKCEPENWFVYYDQSHTIGTDLKQDFNATAIVTINKNSSMRDLLQGVMRMREYPYNQRADFIVPQDLHEQFEQKLTVEKIILLGAKNQSEQLLVQHYTSVRRKIQNEFREDLEQRLKQITDRTKKLKVYRAFSLFFRTTSNIDPYAEFGDIDIESDTFNILTQYQTRTLALWEKVMLDALLPIDQAIKRHLDATTKKIIDDMIPFIPKTIRVARLESVDASVEGQKQMTKLSEQKQESELENQLQNEVQVYAANTDFSIKVPIAHKPWSKSDYESWQQLKLEHPYTLETILNQGTELALSPHLLVSENYRKTFNNIEKLTDLAKKPIQYVLMRKDKLNHISAMIITQREASELLPLTEGDNQNATADVWIETVQGCLFAGTKPKGDLPLQYQSIIEQIKFVSGQLESLEENLPNTHWFTPKNAKKLLAYFKKYILPEEPSNGAIFPYVEKRVLDKISPVPPKQLLTSFHASIVKQFPETETSGKDAALDTKTSQDTNSTKDTSRDTKTSRETDNTTSKNVKSVVGYYESNDILILRDALLTKDKLKVNADNLVVPLDPNQLNRYNTYLLPPFVGELGLDGLMEAICIALLEGGDKQILFPYRMVAAQHWITGQILIKNNQISIQVHDSAKIYQNESFIQKLESCLLSPQVFNAFVSHNDRVAKCKQNIERLKTLFFDNNNRPKIAFMNKQRSQILPIQTDLMDSTGSLKNVYCGGYSTRLMHSLTLKNANPQPINISSEAIWECGINDDRTLRAEDAETVKQYNPAKAASFGSRVEAHQYLTTAAHHVKAAALRDNTQKAFSEIERLVKLLSPNVVEIIRKDILSIQLDKNNPEINKIIKDRLVAIYENNKAILAQDNPLLCFFQNHNNDINKNTEINSSVILKDLWEGFVDILSKNPLQNIPAQKA